MLLALALTTVLTQAPLAGAQAQEGPSAAGRLTAQGAFGVLGAAGGGVAGFFAGRALASGLPCPSGGSDLCTTRAIYGVIGGAFLGSTLAVQLTGHVLGAHGPWWATALGGVTGAATGFLIGAGINAITGGEGVGAMIGVGSIFALTLVGGVVGYELGHRAQSPPARVTLLPTAGQAGSGLALVGIF